jgi:hypothetical protein
MTISQPLRQALRRPRSNRPFPHMNSRKAAVKIGARR